MKRPVQLRIGPQRDGLPEIVNRVLQDMLAMFVNNFRDHWDDHLPYLLMAYRTTVHESTGLSPFKMMLGREMNCPIDIIAGRPPDFEPPRCPVEYVNCLQFSLDETFYFAKHNLRKAANRQKRNYEKNSKPRHFENENYAWRWYPPHANIKLGLGWIGPYKIVKRYLRLGPFSSM